MVSTGIFDRAGAREPIHAGAAGSSRSSRCTAGAALTCARFLRVERGKIFAFLAAECPCGAPLLRCLLSQLEARQPVVDIRPPCAKIDRPTHCFPEFTVIDDVNARVGLPQSRCAVAAISIASG